MAELTVMRAYAAMQAFLMLHFERIDSDDIGALLSDMQLLEDGGSADPATLAEWKRCVGEVLGESSRRDAAE